MPVEEQSIENEDQTQVILDTITSNLTETLQPAMEEIDKTMNAVYSSQELVTKQLDALEMCLNEFQHLPQFTSISQYITKLAVARSNLTTLSKDVSRIVERTETIKQTIRDKQEVFTALKQSQPDQFIGVGLYDDDAHLLEP